MRPAHILLTATLLLFSALPAFPSAKEDFPIKKQPELQQIKPKKPVKIKLKRTAKDEYSWELSGDDVEEIVRTDHRLRKLLNVK
jgi:hypothetical protein